MPKPERHGTSTRGFLFADLRQYTAFVERHGAHRAAAMLDRYRTLVRAAVAEFDGAEIRTEGDSFYVVFDSASAAIACGLAIVRGAQAAGQADAEAAFQVGIGIHAGETVETAEGYVGSAVNIAARICAQAGPNQVLVSDTVRALTAGVVDASFVPVGRRRLKGLRDPIELYRAIGEGAPAAPRSVLSTTWHGPAPLALGALAVAVLAVAFIVRPGFGSGDDELGGGASSTPDPNLALASAGQSEAASAAASPSPGTQVDEYPNRFETELLTMIPASHHAQCERADSADTPVLDNAEIAGTPPRLLLHPLPMSLYGGIHCELGGISAPDSVWYWRLGAREEGPGWIAQHAAKIDAVSGSCASDVPVVERWSFGESSGRLLCFTTETGDAILAWTYDQTNVFGRAVRDDRNMAALLEWWAAEARFPPD